jgi:hypothetical protein
MGKKKDDENIPEIPIDADPLNADWLKVMDFILNPEKDFKNKEYLKGLADRFSEEEKEKLRDLAKKYGIGGKK